MASDFTKTFLQIRSELSLEALVGFGQARDGRGKDRLQIRIVQKVQKRFQKIMNKPTQQDKGTRY